MEKLKRDIEDLEAALREELSRPRIRLSGEIDHVQRLLAVEKNRNYSLTQEMDILKEDLENAANLIESLKDEITHENKKNEELKKQILNLNKELEKNRASSGSSANVVGNHVELESERKRRQMAEMELEAYRRQTKHTDNNQQIANARRVAISLARHCVQLSQELDSLRYSQTSSIQKISKEDLKAVLVTKEIPKPASQTIAQPMQATHLSVPKSGWGNAEEDDDLFSVLN
jgi:predicted RND superfamily exporter protein